MWVCVLLGHPQNVLFCFFVFPFGFPLKQNKGYQLKTSTLPANLQPGWRGPGRLLLYLSKGPFLWRNPRGKADSRVVVWGGTWVLGQLAVGQNQCYHWGRCTTHFRTYFRDRDVHWGYEVANHLLAPVSKSKMVTPQTTPGIYPLLKGALYLVVTKPGYTHKSHGCKSPKWVIAPGLLIYFPDVPDRPFSMGMVPLTPWMVAKSISHHLRSPGILRFPRRRLSHDHHWVRFGFWGIPTSFRGWGGARKDGGGRLLVWDSDPHGGCFSW